VRSRNGRVGAVTERPGGRQVRGDHISRAYSERKLNLHRHTLPMECLPSDFQWGLGITGRLVIKWRKVNVFEE